MVRNGTVADATLIAASRSTKKRTRRRNPEIHQTRKGNPWHFGCKAPVETDAASGPHGGATAANMRDVTQAHALPHGRSTRRRCRCRLQGVDKRDEVKLRHPEVSWRVAMRPGKRRQLDMTQPPGAILEPIGTVKARIRVRQAHLWCGEMRLSLHQGPLQGPEEERGAGRDALDAGQSGAGAQAADAALRGVSAPERGANARYGLQKVPAGVETAPKACRNDA